VIAWALEGAGLVWLSARRADGKLAIAACAALVLAIIALVVGAQRPELVDHLTFVANLRFAGFAAVAGGLFLASHLLRPPLHPLPAYVIGHVVALVAIGLELVTAIQAGIAEAAQSGTITVAITILMAVYAVMR
jgi:hypothetical protein